MRIFNLLLVLLLLSFTAFSQELKMSAVPEPVFHSEQEKSAFEKLNKGDFESEFMLLCTLKEHSNPTQGQSHAAALKDFIEEIRPKVEKTRSPEKKIKKIHKEVHRTFLERLCS